MLLPLLAILIGFTVLAWAADRFVIGAAGTANNLGMSPLFVGLTVVALGTSAPEMLVSAVAAWQGNPGLAIGNAIGSNITNSALVLGAAALVTPLAIRRSALTRELPVLIGLILIAWLLLADGHLGRFEGLLLVGGVAPLLWWMARIGQRDDAASVHPDAAVTSLDLRASLKWLLIGGMVLLISSRAVVWGSLEVATLLGVSDTVIGLSIVAFGTSLPELAASVAGALRNEHDIAVGNVIGSNMFNILVVLGLPGIIAPAEFAPEVLTRDFPVMLGITVAVMGLAALNPRMPRLGRLRGVLLVMAFIAYILLLYDKLP